MMWRALRPTPVSWLDMHGVSFFVSTNTTCGNERYYVDSALNEMADALDGAAGCARRGLAPARGTARGRLAQG